MRGFFMFGSLVDRPRTDTGSNRALRQLLRPRIVRRGTAHTDQDQVPIVAQPGSAHHPTEVGITIHRTRAVPTVLR